MNSKQKSVLILAHIDGWLEAFSEEDVDVKIVNMPFVGNVESEIAAEQYLEKTLPLRYRKIYWPVNKRASLMLRRVLPSDIRQAKWEMALLSRLSKMKDKMKNEVAA